MRKKSGRGKEKKTSTNNERDREKGENGGWGKPGEAGVMEG